MCVGQMDPNAVEKWRKAHPSISAGWATITDAAQDAPSADLEELLEQRNWASRNGWDPDAIAPPMRGGIYERDRPVQERSSWILVTIGAVAVLFALTVLKL